MRRITILLLAAIFAQISSVANSISAPADDSLYADLYVDEISITRRPEAMQEPDPVPGEQSPVKAVLPLAVWTKIKGNAAGLERLRGGRFQLFHLWTESCPLTGAVSTIAPDGEKKVGVNGRKAWPLIAVDLAPEVSARDWFDWRTVSKRLYVQNCRYTVTVVDERGVKLPCRGMPAGCELSFSARYPE